MKAVYAAGTDYDNPLSQLKVGELDTPETKPFWSTIHVAAASVNHHDIWSLQGVGLSAEQTPMILGTDASGVLDEDIPVRKGRKAGADVVLYTFVETGARLPHKVDAVIESVGAATWSHSVKSVRPGGTIAICGATTGDQPGAELTRIFFQDIRVQGNTMGSRDDFARLLKFVEHADLHPVIDSTYALADAPAAFRKVVDGDVFGKVVLHIEPSK